MTTSTCSAKATNRRTTTTSAIEFRFDDDGALVDLEPPSPVDETIDLRSSRDEEPVEHLVQLSSGDVVTVTGANAYQPEGPMTTFFATGSSRGTIDSWSVRVASYRTNDIMSVQRRIASAAPSQHHRPNLIAV